MISPAILEALQLQALAIQKLIYYVATQQAVRKHEITTASHTPSPQHHKRRTPYTIRIINDKHQHHLSQSHHTSIRTHPTPHTPITNNNHNHIPYLIPQNFNTPRPTTPRTRTRTREHGQRRTKQREKKTTKNTITKATGTRTIRTR